MVWLHRFGHVSSKAINILASTSFAIYFIHAFMLRFADEWMDAAGMRIESPWLWYPAVTVGMILVCMLLALGVKKLAPNHSRYITLLVIDG